MNGPTSPPDDVLDAIGALQAVERLFDDELTILISGELAESGLDVLREIVTDAVCAAFGEQLEEGPEWHAGVNEWASDIYFRADRTLELIDDAKRGAS